MGGSSSSLGDTILFPAPEPSYDENLRGLVWIEEDFASRPPLSSAASSAIEAEVSRDRHKRASCFPAIFVPSPNGKAKHVVLYWHGNSCDLGHINEELEMLGGFVDCHCLAIEFPGYGLASSCSAAAATAAAAAASSSSRKVRFSLSETINRWSRAAFNFLVWLGVPSESIICFGRSIGTGPAAQLAADLKDEGILVGGVVLHAPYISVHKIVAEYSSLGTWLIEDHWNNARSLSRLSPSTPLLIIHGEDDEVIPTAHGRRLFENYEGGEEVKEGFFPADSSHNAYYIIDDIGKPLQVFLKDKARGGASAPFEVSIPAFVRERPLHAAAPVHASLTASGLPAGETVRDAAGLAAAAAACDAAAAAKAAAPPDGRGHAEATAAVTAAGETVSSAAASQAAAGSAARQPSASAAAAAATVAAAASAEKAAAAQTAATKAAGSTTSGSSSTGSSSSSSSGSSSSPAAFHRLLESGLLDSDVLHEIVGGAIREAQSADISKAADKPAKDAAK